MTHSNLESPFEIYEASRTTSCSLLKMQFRYKFQLSWHNWRTSPKSQIARPKKTKPITLASSSRSEWPHKLIDVFVSLINCLESTHYQFAFINLRRTRVENSLWNEATFFYHFHFSTTLTTSHFFAALFFAFRENKKKMFFAKCF